MIAWIRWFLFVCLPGAGEATKPRGRSLEDLEYEADRALYAQDPEFAVEMGYEPPKPQMQNAQMQNMDRLGAFSGGLGGGLSALQAWQAVNSHLEKRPQ